MAPKQGVERQSPHHPDADAPPHAANEQIRSHALHFARYKLCRQTLCVTFANGNGRTEQALASKDGSSPSDHKAKHQPARKEYLRREEVAGELSCQGTYLTSAQDGKRYQPKVFSLDVIQAASLYNVLQDYPRLHPAHPAL